MDPPEQPTIWPPAPTLPPPDKEDPAKFAVFVPAWLAYVLKESAIPCAILIGFETILHLLQHRPLGSWRWYMIVVATMLGYNGCKYMIKVWRQRIKTKL